MYSFIPQTTLFLSFAVIIYLFIKAAPRVDAQQHSFLKGKRRLLQLVEKLPLEKADNWLNKTLEKILRRIKVIILKIDNRLTTFLDKVREANAKTNGNGVHDNKPHIFSFTDRNNEMKDD